MAIKKMFGGYSGPMAITNGMGQQPDGYGAMTNSPDFFTAPKVAARAPAFTPDGTAGNRLKQLLTDPNSFQGTPGFKFALDTGLQALDRNNSTIRNTPNALLEAMKYGTGLAQQDYGNEVQRLGQLTGQEQQYDLGLGANSNTATRNGNDLLLGEQGNANTRYGIDTTARTSRYNTDAATGLGYAKTAADYSLGLGANANTATRNANDLALGTGANANTAQNNWFNYDLGKGRNANDAAGIFANYDLGQGRNAIDWYNAGTNRGAAQSTAYNQSQNNALNWYRAKPRSGINSVTGGAWYNTGA